MMMNGWSMQATLESLVQAIDSGVIVALAASLIWGGLSVVLSPCHLASIPLIVGFISGQGELTSRRAGWISLLFSFGILLTILLIGCVTAAAGWILGDIGTWINYPVAVLFVVIGLHLLDVISLPLGFAVRPGMQSRGAWGAFLLGLVFGLALGPCTFAYLAPMLGIVFRSGGSDSAYGMTLLLMYGIGHCAVLVIAGTSVQLVQRYLNWNETSRAGGYLRRLCGILVVLGGVYLVYLA